MKHLNDALTDGVLGAAIEVHRILGAGLSEVHYKRAMSIELRIRGITHELEVLVDLEYKGESIGKGKVDIFVERKLIVELKTVESLHTGHTRQVLAYLKADPNADTALLINFSHPTLKEGIKRVKLST